MVKSQLHYFHPSWISPSTEDHACDLCIYGGTAAGVIAAITAAGAGLRVCLAHPGLRLGGMTTGGLSHTDFGQQAAIGGLSREFYRRVGAKYGRAESWGFEPHIAQEVLDAWIASTPVVVRCGQFLEAVERRGSRIHELVFLGGMRVRARAFMDCTYEGDLMARAGVPYTVGREGNAAYGETMNGAQIHQTHQFDGEVSPWRVPGKPESGLLPGIEDAGPIEIGCGDRRVQAYNFRVCMTDDPGLRVPFPEPGDYDPGRYELAARWLSITKADLFRKFDRITPGKTDTNNHGAVSTDLIGASSRWPEADYPEREAIFQEHVSWQKGLHFFMANDPRVPVPIRERYARFGLPKDEFPDTDHWPRELYVREARRMVGDVVITERHCRSEQPCREPVGLGSYQMDSHHCRRLVVGGFVKNEGDVQAPLERPYGIERAAIVPPESSCVNLVVPVCLSASHIAYGSVRMEPVFMLLAQSGALLAAEALEADQPVQAVPYGGLKARLLAAGQILEAAP